MCVCVSMCMSVCILYKYLILKMNISIGQRL